MTKRWITRDAGNVASANIIDRLLAVRGIAPEEATEFFQPSWNGGVHDPSLFSQMGTAVERIFNGLAARERITVYGDYDADGVTGSTVLITTLREMESRLSPGTTSCIDWYIPHRDKEGYGLNPTSVELLAARGTKLIITVDCGIANVAEAAQARECGMDVIVVDHHQFGDILPDGILIHPKLPGEKYPFPHLAAVGVAWKVACALITEARTRGLDIQDGWEKWLLDLVAIATVTDMVPMVGENRVLETYGLKVLNRSRRPGIKALIKAAGFVQGELNTESVGFGLGPRINAAGRMDHASLALELLLSDTDEQAATFCEKIEQCNKDRQKAVARMMVEAEAQMASHPDASVVVLHSEAWPPALVGLVAGKFADRTGKPTIAIGKHGDRWVGSGRSFHWYDIAAGMKRAGESILTHCGGHAQACGFSFTDTGRMQELKERIWADCSRLVDPAVSVPTLTIDTDIGLEHIDWALIDALEKLQPFGEKNRKPIFAAHGLRVQDRVVMGQTQKHVRLSLRSNGGRQLKFVGFNMAHRLPEIEGSSYIDVAFELGVNMWNGRRDIQCKLIDVRPSASTIEA